MEVAECPLAGAGELRASVERAEATFPPGASDSPSDSLSEGHVVTMQAQTHPLPQGHLAPDSEPTSGRGDSIPLPDALDGLAAGGGQLTGAPMPSDPHRLDVTRESWDLLETAQVLSEIAGPFPPGSGTSEEESPPNPLARVSDPHLLVLSTAQTENPELQVTEEVILELPNGIKMYGKDLSGLTELLHPTQVLLQVGPRKFTLATTDALLPAGSLVFTVSQETTQDETPVKQPDAEVEGSLYRCYLCSLTFNRRGNYVRHKKIHMVNTEEDARYKCPHCDRQFIQHCDLRRHTHVHTGTQPHKCELCGKAFLRASDLVVHRRFHTKDRPFQCGQCQKSFFQSGDLRRHVRNIHMTNARMLSCGHCKKKYIKEATLLHHIQTVHQDILLHTLKEQEQHSSDVMVAEVGNGDEDERVLSGYRLPHVETSTTDDNVLSTEAGVHGETALEEPHAPHYDTETNPSVSGQLLESTVTDSARGQMQALLGCSGSGPGLVLIDMHPAVTIA
ncbi:zinc finger protein 154-like [Leucoraja erinacea]|uniref:zinc finger protein 154-like n=1 Tax=Leucoraja erinaceus TaxID=7782 RepID=UPI002458BD48|nr:zinc finger protein 154-like [Leucoraja erinacea]